MSMSAYLLTLGKPWQYLSWDECCQTRPIQPRVEFGEKYSNLGPQLGEDILLGFRDALDQTFEPQPTQIVGHLRPGVRAIAHSPKAGDPLSQRLVRETLGDQSEVGQGGQNGHDAVITKT